MVASKPKFHPG